MLLDLDVNRPLVTQLTPKKKVLLFEKSHDSFTNEANDSKIFKSSDTSSLSHNKMSESLSKALGLFPKSILPEKSTPSYGSSDVDKTNLFLKDTSSNSKDDDFKTMPLTDITLSKERKEALSYNDSNSTSLEENKSSDQSIRSIESSLNQSREGNKYDKENTSSKDDSQKDSVSSVAQSASKNNLDPVQIDDKGKRSSITYDIDKTPDEENVSKSTKKKVRKRARKLEALVKENMKGNKESKDKIQWPSPEDVKRAYAELNLVPPSSPNKIFK